VKSTLEETLAFQMRALKFPCPERQLRFHPTRRWKFDFAWPNQKLAVEVDGGTWTHGGHSRGKGFENDCYKINEAQLMGWRVYRFTCDMVTNGEALDVIKRALAG
jgi:very-short-patch-repair endonuclease